MDTVTLEYGPLITGIGGGLALFLYGMRKMTESLKIVAGARMKTFLGRVTTNRFTAAIAGAGVTAVIQSSSVTTVLVVGFITSGLLTLSQSVGIILGANVGTTVTAQIIAFKVTKYALLMIASGFLIELTGRQEKTRQYGVALMGLGLIFFGMDLMSDAASPLRSYEPFINLMQEMRNPLIGILVGAAFTAMVQSSSATTGIVIVLAGEGLLSLEAGIALILGANVGTCITALLAGIGQPRESLQAAVVHIIFNIGGVALWYAFIPQFADLIRDFSPDNPGVEASARLAVETPRQIANAHTIFNIGNAVIFIWFTTPLAWIARKLVPPQKKKAVDDHQPIYLDDYYLQQPSVALDRARLEIDHLAKIVIDMVDQSCSVVLGGLPGEVAKLHDVERVVDDLHGAIISYLGRLSFTELVEPQPQRIYEYIAAANEWENIADVVGTSLVRSGNKRLSSQFQVSDATRKMLQPLHAAVLESGRNALKSFNESNVTLARDVTASKQRVNKLAMKVQSHLVKRLVADEPERLTAFRIESDILEDYKRLHTLFRRIAKIVHEVETAEPVASPPEV